MADLKIPQAPAHLPKHVADKWQATYSDTLKRTAREQGDKPDEKAQHLAARRAAHAAVKVDPPETFEQANSLIDEFKRKGPDAYKIIGHGTRKVRGEDHIVVVTNAGQKLLFPVPASEIASAPKPEKKGDGKSSEGKGKDGKAADGKSNDPDSKEPTA
jgi:hypothetical protein